MQSANLLLTLAQVAIGLAGFTAIIVAVNSKPIQEWHAADKLNLRLLVQVSFLVLFFCVFPYVLAVSLPPDEVWFYGLVAYGVVHVFDVSSFLFNTTKETPRVFVYHACVGLLIALSQVAIAFFGNAVLRETAYIATLIWHLYVMYLAFVLLLYQKRKAK
jgi:hypothetical protein